MSAEAFGRQLLDEVKEESLVDVGEQSLIPRFLLLIIFLL